MIILLFMLLAGHTSYISPSSHHNQSANIATPKSLLLRYIINGETTKARDRILQLPRSLHARNRQGKKALHFAAEAGNSELISFLLTGSRRYNVEIDEFSCEKITPLGYAIKNKHYYAAQALLELGASPNLILDEMPALIYCIKNNLIELRNLLIAKTTNNNLLAQALETAIKQNDLDLTIQLVTLGTTLPENIHSSDPCECITFIKAIKQILKGDMREVQKEFPYKPSNSHRMSLEQILGIATSYAKRQNLARYNNIYIQWRNCEFFYGRNQA